VSRPRLLLAVETGAVVAIVGCLVALAARHPWRLDLTPQHRFTLSPHTHEVLGRLAEDVRITVFYSSQEPAVRRAMADLLGLYADASPRIHVRLLDLDRSPGAAHDLDVSAYNVGVAEAGGRRVRIDPVTEVEVTAALRRVAGTPPVTTYFVLGHGEHDPRVADARGGAAEAADALAADGFVLRAVEGIARVPADAGLVVLAGPRRDLAPAEVAALAAYVERGGSMLLLADPGAPPSVHALAARFGIELGDDVVVDDRGRLFGTDGLGARVAALNQSLVPAAPPAAALLPVAQSVRLVDRPGVQGEYLATTGEATWADVDRRALSRAEVAFRPGRDRRGPLPVAALARSAAPGGREGRLVVVGDADFVTNLDLNLLGNRDLLLIAAELAAHTEVLAAPRPSAPPGGTFSPLALTAREARLVFWTTVVTPAALLAAMAAVMARRRAA
jgi:ABC-type uncharacterized transport system involved in gliding motility auxiliary subunit